MKRFPPSVCLLAVLTTAVSASAQYGLYGSPEVVPLPETGQATVPCSGYAVPAFTPNPYASATPQTPVMQPEMAQPMPSQPTPAARPMFPAQRVSPQPVWAQPRPVYGNHFTPQRKPKQQAAPRRAPRVPTPPSPPSDPAGPSPSPSDHSDAASIPDPTTGQTDPAGQDQPVLDYSMGYSACGGSLTDAVDHGSACGAYGEGCGYDGYAFAGDPDACGYGQDRSGGIFGTCGRMLGYQHNPCMPCPWYGSIMGLYMSRNDANRVWTSFQTNNQANQLTNTNDIGLTWKPGFEVTFGRRIGCCGQGPWALEASYFYIDNFEGYHSTTAHPSVSTPLTFGDCHFTNTGHGTGVNTWYDGAQEHRLWRRNEIHNVEVSLVRTRMLASCETPWDFEWEVGVRYFQFDESLRFGTLSSDGADWSDAAETAFLDEDVKNSLIGGQLGFNAGWYFHPSWRLFIGPKFGIYNNHIEQRAALYRGDGEAATTTGSYADFPVKSETNELAFLTQFDVGLDWQMTQRFSAQVGYRVIIASGIALADHQVPHFINDTPEFNHIDNNGELILHGAFAGGTFNY